MKILLSLALLSLSACDNGIEPLQESKTLSTSDSTVCWSQPVGDARNTPWTDPRNCTQTETDSTWVRTCEYGDTVQVSIAYSQYYKELHPNFPHNGGGVVHTIVNGDTLSSKEW